LAFAQGRPRCGVVLGAPLKLGQLPPRTGGVPGAHRHRYQFTLRAGGFGEIAQLGKPMAQGS
jgi:hypothetical protein